MSEIDAVFEQLRARHGKAFIPFLTAGDPDLDVTAALLDALDGVASLCELGVPYSDPVADGPVIQASYTRALNGGVTVEAIARMLACRPTPTGLPLVWMVGYAIVLRHGLEAFVAAARQVGVSGLIVPDLPFEESHALREVCDAAGMDLVQLVAPTTSPERARKIAEASRGFLYYVSVAGITGERATLPREMVDHVAALREWSRVPVCVGFGISTAEQAGQVARIADGVIVGSALVRELAECDESEESRRRVVARIRAKAEAFANALHHSVD